MTTISDRTALGGYQLRLPTFEGPLDVLIRLIERDQLAVTDVSLVAVTDQFLAYLAGMDKAAGAGGAAAATVAEFAAVGSRLVLLKSRSILPRPPRPEPDEEPEDLVRQLVAYRTMREAAKLLGERDRMSVGAFARGNSVALPDAPPLRLAPGRPVALARAVRRRLTVVPSPRSVVAVRPTVTLREMTERLLVALSGQRELPFGRLRAECDDRREVLVAFLAVLVLVRRRVVAAEQAEMFGEITLRRAAPPVSHAPVPTLTPDGIDG